MTKSLRGEEIRAAYEKAEADFFKYSEGELYDKSVSVALYYILNAVSQESVKTLISQSNQYIPDLLDIIEHLQDEIVDRDLYGSTHYFQDSLRMSQGDNARLKGENRKLKKRIKELEEQLSITKSL